MINRSTLPRRKYLCNFNEKNRWPLFSNEPSRPAGGAQNRKKISYSKCFKNGGKRKDKVLVFIISILDAINHWCSLKSDWLPLVQFVYR